MKDSENLNKNNKRQIMVTFFLFLIIFCILCVYLVHFVINNASDLINNSYNQTQEILSEKNTRGKILAKDGTVLAQTLYKSDGSEYRDYPYKEVFSHIIGYSTNGKMGVEELANYYLLNSNSSVLTKVNNGKEGNKNPGDNVYTTLDVKLQQTADSELGLYKGAIIVSEVKTGKILALVSHPNFDPNEISEIWDEIINDSSNSQLLNRATQGLYPPGSTFKIVTALEYIRETDGNTSDYSFDCNGSFQIGDSKISCYHGQKHGLVDFETSFAKSCNSSFANIGVGLNMVSFNNTLKDLLFNCELSYDLPSSTSYCETEENMSNEDIMQTAIGQGKTQMTPLHLNLITNAIANNGILMTPYVLDSVYSEDGTLIKKFNSQKYKDLMTSDEADTLKELMRGVVTNGTASKLDGLEYTAAGKTGTAEYNSNKGDSHAWFTGFAPYEDPEISVTVIVEGAGSGGDYAVPIAKKIFDAYFNE